MEEGQRSVRSASEVREKWVKRSNFGACLSRAVGSTALSPVDTRCQEPCLQLEIGHEYQSRVAGMSRPLSGALHRTLQIARPQSRGHLGDGGSSRPTMRGPISSV